MKQFLIAALFLAFLVAFSAAQSYNITNSQIYGNGLTSDTAGVLATFYIQLRTTTNTTYASCPSTNPFTATLTGGVSNRSIAAVCTNGRYTYQYTAPTVAGPYNVVIVAAGLPNNGTLSYAVTVSPGPIYPGNTIATGIPAPFTGIVGQKYNFTVTPYDQYNNRIYSCPNAPSQWSVVVAGVQNGQGSITKCDSKSGIYSGTFSATQSGGYDMTIQINNGYIRGSPFHLNLGPGPISPPNCVYLPSTSEVYAGTVTPFQVAAYDAYNNPITTCTVVEFEAALELKGAVVAPVNYVGCSAGVYTLNFTETIANDGYLLDVKINNISIAKSPFNVEVSAALKIDPSKTTASGVGLYNATAGVPASVTIMPEDKYGNANMRCDASWSDFDLELYAVSNNSLTCSGQVIGCESATGYYTAQWTCYIATVYSLSITYQTVPINNGTVYSPTVVPGPLTGPETYASGLGLRDAYAGVNSYVYLDPHDQYGNQITTCDKAHFDPDLLSIVVNDENGNNIGGTVDNCTASPNGAVITLHYNITSIDLTILSIVYANNSIIDSPWLLTTHAGPPAAGNCNATGTGLHWANAGEYGVFQVTCADRFDNVITDCLPLENWFYSLTGSNNLTGVPYQCLNSTGVAQTLFRYNQTVSGEYGLIFGYDNQTLNPYDVTVYPGPFDPKNSVAVGDGVYSQTIRAGDRTIFEILARDRWGNEVTNCLNHSLIGISSVPPLRPSSNKFVVLPCNSTNRTLVQYASTLASKYQLTITYSGVEIQNSPYSPRIIAGPLDYDTIVANGTGLTYAQAGVPASLTLQGNDKYGNPVNYCNSSEFENFGLSLDLDNSTQKAHVDGVVWSCGVINGAGTYQANYTAYVAGYYDFHITYLDDDIPQSPFEPLVVPGPNNYSQAYVYAVQDQTVAGEYGYLEVIPRDSYQNNLTSCVPYLMFTANFSGVRAGDQKVFNYSYPSAVCNQTGPYAYWTIPFVLDGATTYTVNVYGTNSGQGVYNSPLKTLVVPNVISAPNSYLNNFDPTAVYVVGQTVDYMLTVADRYQNNITDCPDTNYSDFSVYTKAAKTYPGSITCENGVYQGTFTALQVGIYKLYIQYMSANFMGSPYTPLNFTYGYPSGLSVAHGPGVESDSIVAGTTTTFVIYTTNQYNITIESCPPAPFSAKNWTVTFDEAYRYDSDATTIQVGDCIEGTGNFPAWYTPTKARQYSIDIQLNGKEIRDDPYTPTVIPGPIDVSMTIITGLNGTGDNGTIILQTRDHWGNAETRVNLSQFQIGLSPRCAQSTIRTTADAGTIYAQYQVYEGGVYCPSIEYFDGPTPYIFPLNGTIHATGGVACNNSCNYQGYCFKNQEPSTASTNYSCSCFQGYTGVECADKMSCKILSLSS
jgi:hypothetical protein